MNTGNMDKRVQFLQYKDIKNKLGLTEQVPITVLKCWAQIEPVRGREYYEGQKDRTENAYKITIRYRKNLSAAMLIQYQSHIFEIQNIVDPYMAHDTLEIYCNEKSRGTGVMS